MQHRGFLLSVCGSAVVLAMAAGCAHAPSVMPNPQRQEVYQFADEIFGISRDYRVVEVPPHGDVPKMADELAQILSEGKSSDVKVVVVGPYDELTAQVVTEALGKVKGQSLNKLQLLYIAWPEHEAPAAALAKEAGIQFYFRPTGSNLQHRS